MAAPQLTLRQPPNVDFVVGYPGIAPGPPDRPHAAVQGTLEVRCPQPTKAKWVRVELRKIEHLPGGAQFVDHVGQSPFTVWQPQEGEWGVLNSRDFEFSMRIPESVPPTIELENKSGIHYELIATVCTKGKKGILRRDATPTLSTAHPIVILKHELHSNWPVYSQHDRRETSKEGLTLTVERSRTCIGPGEQLELNTSLKSESPIPFSFRGFDMTLRENISFRAHPGATTSKKVNVPQARTTVIGDQKISANVVLHHGMQHIAMITCALPQSYNAMSVDAARLIDIRYTIHVSAVLEGGRVLDLQIPLTVSPFPRQYSEEVLSRIGLPPSALDHPSRAHLHSTPAPTPSPSQQIAHAAMAGSSTMQQRLPQQPQSQSQHGYHIQERVGGGRASATYAAPPTAPPPMTNGRPSYNEFGLANGSQPSNASAHNVQYAPPTSAPPIVAPSPPLSPPVMASPPSVGRFAISNLHELDELPPAGTGGSYLSADEEKKRLKASMGQPPIAAQSSSQSSNVTARPVEQGTQSVGSQAWLPAEEEKKRLYEKAKADAERAQRKAANMSSGGSTKLSPKGSQFGHTKDSSVSIPPAATRTTSPPPRSSDWLSAEEEKKRLYEKAQATAKKTQARALTGGSTTSETALASTNKDIVNPYTYAPTSSNSGADLYKSAIKNLKGSLAAPAVASTPPRVQSPPIGPPQTSSPQYTHISEYSTSGSGTSSGSHPPQPPVGNASAFPSAEEEKARLRYEEAKRAVDKHQAESWEPSPPAQPYSTPPPTQVYASPPGVTNGLQLARQPSHRTPGSPPPFSTPVMGYTAESDLPEKEKIKLAFARRDAMLEQQHEGSEPPPPDYGGSPSREPLLAYSSPPPSASFVPLSAAEEKARLKAQYEAEEAAGRAGAGGSGMRSPPPEPPSYIAETRPLTAVEEKALLRARMAAEQPVGASPPAPPPKLKTPSASGSPRLQHLTYQSTGSSASDIAPRDPSISAGKQRAASNANMPALGSLGRATSMTVSPQPMATRMVAPPAPPPLAPRPPKEYIKQTQEEDAKIRRLTSDPAAFSDTLRDDQRTRTNSIRVPPLPGSPTQSVWLQSGGPEYLASPQSDFGLGLRPFSPIDLSLDALNKSNKPSTRASTYSRQEFEL